MIKVLLLIVMYNLSNGEIVSVYQQGNKFPGFESREQCEAIVKQDLHKLEVPEGFGVYVECVVPSLSNETTIT